MRITDKINFRQPKYMLPATDVLTFSPNGDYVRVKPQPENQTEE